MKKLFSVLCIVLAVSMMLSLCACKRNGDDATPDEASTSASSEANTTEETDVSSSATEASSSEEDESSSTEETTAESADAGSDSNSNSGSDQPVAQNPDGEEIFGAGSESQPYLEMPDTSTMTVKTVSIPAGKALYYSIYRVGGKYFVIDDPDAYVIYNGTRYNSSGGSVSFLVESALASDAVPFQIGNSGSSAKSFTIHLYEPKGSWENPEIISKLDGKTITLSLYAGNDLGYNYKYTAEKTGKVRFYVLNDKVDYLFSATRNQKSDGLEIPIQYTFEADVKSDNTGNYIEFDVVKGEVIRISISAKPQGKWYPAVTVKWNGKFV